MLDRENKAPARFEQTTERGEQGINRRHIHQGHVADRSIKPPLPKRHKLSFQSRVNQGILNYMVAGSCSLARWKSLP